MHEHRDGLDGVGAIVNDNYGGGDDNYATTVGGFSLWKDDERDMAGTGKNSCRRPAKVIVADQSTPSFAFLHGRKRH